jgi:hypothetical protein
MHAALLMALLASLLALATSPATIHSPGGTHIILPNDDGGWSGGEGVNGGGPPGHP